MQSFCRVFVFCAFVGGVLCCAVAVFCFLFCFILLKILFSYSCVMYLLCLCCGFYSARGCVLPCPVCCVLCGAEASEVLRSTLEVQQALVKELREQTQILAQEKETLEKRCLQQSQHIQHLQQELCHSHTERGNSTGASSLAAIHPTALTEPIQH